MEKKPSQKRGQEKVDLIVKSAIEEFLFSGINSTSTNAIAKHAGIPVGSIYQFFKDKYAILDYLVEKYKASMTEIIRNTPPHFDQSAQLVYLIQSSLDLKHKEKYCTIIFVEPMMREGLVDFLLPFLPWAREKSEPILRIVLALFTIEGTSADLSGENFVQIVLSVIGALLAREG